MQRLVPLLLFSASLFAADLSAVRNVYVMPMARGLDQYLASRLTAHGVFQVVTDPKLADAVLTDHVGDSLAAQLETISPTPKPEPDEEEEPEAKVDAKADAKADAKPAAKAQKQQQDDTSSMISGLGGNTMNKADTAAPISSFGRSKGNIFLVDAKSRQVIWSTYDPPKTTTARDLNHTASDIVSRIRKDLSAKAKQK